jgi:predicted permease
VNSVDYADLSAALNLLSLSEREGCAVSSFLLDLKYALRRMRRTPMLTCSTLIALSVGIGLNAGIFTILSGFWLSAPVTKNPATFVQIIPQYSGWFSTADQTTAFTTQDYEALKNQSNSLADVAAWSGGGGAGEITLDGDPRQAGLVLVTCNFFQVYGLGPPKAGRLFLPEECLTPSSAPVAVLSESLWRNRYGGDPSIVGKVIHINQNPYTVVGIVQPNSTGSMRNVLWIPYTMQPQIYHGNNAFRNSAWPWLTLAGRIRSSHSRSNAQAELNLIAQEQDELIPGRKTTLVLTNGSFIEYPTYRALGLTVIMLIMAPTLLVLVVACVNVATILLSQAVQRKGEIAIRLALGADRSRIIRTLATESVLMLGVAAIISLYLSYKIPEQFWTFVLPQGGFDAVNPDWHVFTFLAGVTILAACFASFAPAVESLKVDIFTTLKGREMASTGRSRLRRIVVVGQVAMSFVLVAAAVLFVRQQHMITSVYPGFETKQVMIVPLNLGDPSHNRRSESLLFQSIQERVRGLPGVESVSYASIVPFADVSPVEIRLPEQEKGRGRKACVDIVSSDFFDTLGISIVRGRAFHSFDNLSGTPSAVGIVSRAFEQAFWNGQDSVGKVIQMPDNREIVVVGVAQDTKSEQYGIVDMPRVYVLGAQLSLAGPMLIRFSGEARSVAASIRKAVTDLGSQQLVDPRTLESKIDEEGDKIRRLAEIVVFMACVAISLAVIGLYGVIAFSLNQRTREFGIRMVLGATSERILHAVLLAGIKQIAIGLLIGFALSLPLAPLWSRLTKGSPLQLSAMDFNTYVIAATLLFVVTITPTYLSARRILRLEPMSAIRYE